jgi:hypothetical protein
MAIGRSTSPIEPEPAEAVNLATARYRMCRKTHGAMRSRETGAAMTPPRATIVRRLLCPLERTLA